MRWDMNCAAVFTASSLELMKIGIFLAPGDLRIARIWLSVVSSTFGGQISIFVITTMMGIFKARAMPRCSLDIPMRPLLAATISRQ